MLATLRTRFWHFRDRVRRAGDLATFRALSAGPSGLTTLKLRVNGTVVPVTVRGGTEGVVMSSLILRDESEYRLPSLPDFRPTVILDVGANIGLASIYFATRYPQARIWSVEPLPENLALLEQNLAPFRDRVTILRCGLGEVAGTFPYYPSEDRGNFGGGTFQPGHGDASRATLLPIRTLTEVMQAEHIPPPDVIKLDAEGFEGPILRGAPESIIATTRVVIGELHGIEDYVVLGVFSKTHDVGHHKVWNRPNSSFVAVRHEVLVRSAPAGRGAPQQAPVIRHQRVGRSSFPTLPPGASTRNRYAPCK
jgi:FkbM family methyltransferase